ncbi:MAG: ATP-grasp domain-containing protein, partial [Longimicrobiales bacterium]
MSVAEVRPLAIYYEHPDWFRPLFAELDRRGTPWTALNAGRHSFDPFEVESQYSLVFNRMSPSAYLRGRGHAIFYTTQYLAHLRRQGVRVINDYDAWRTEISKAYQLSLLDSLGLPAPRARVIADPADAPAAAEGFRFPIIVKPNIGGSGAGIRRFDSPQILARAAAERTLDLGIDATALVQEFIPAESGRITRVEVL